MQEHSHFRFSVLENQHWYTFEAIIIDPSYLVVKQLHFNKFHTIILQVMFKIHTVL